jgi:hypothetical protein
VFCSGSAPAALRTVPVRPVWRIIGGAIEFWRCRILRSHKNGEGAATLSLMKKDFLNRSFAKHIISIGLLCHIIEHAMALSQLPNGARNKSPGTSGSRRRDDFTPCRMADALKLGAFLLR